MEEMIARWIREVIAERQKALANQNTLKLIQMNRLLHELNVLRAKLGILTT